MLNSFTSSDQKVGTLVEEDAAGGGNDKGGILLCSVWQPISEMHFITSPFGYLIKLQFNNCHCKNAYMIMLSHSHVVFWLMMSHGHVALWPVLSHCHVLTVMLFSLSCDLDMLTMLSRSCCLVATSSYGKCRLVVMLSCVQCFLVWSFCFIAKVV